MKVVIVCTANVIRSPALACILAARRPELEIESAAVGERARDGLRMRRHMRELMTAAGYGAEAGLHRSRRLADAIRGDLYIGMTDVHMRRLDILRPGCAKLLTRPRVSDPAFGGESAYQLAWEQLQLAAQWLEAQCI